MYFPLTEDSGHDNTVSIFTIYCGDQAVLGPWQSLRFVVNFIIGINEGCRECKPAKAAQAAQLQTFNQSNCLFQLVQSPPQILQ